MPIMMDSENCLLKIIFAIENPQKYMID